MPAMNGATPELAAPKSVNSKSRFAWRTGSAGCFGVIAVMIRLIVDSRPCLSLILDRPNRDHAHAALPLREDNVIRRLVAVEKSMIFATAKYAYAAMLFSAPFILCSMLFPFLYTFFVRPEASNRTRTVAAAP